MYIPTSRKRKLIKNTEDLKVNNLTIKPIKNGDTYISWYRRTYQLSRNCE